MQQAKTPFRRPAPRPFPRFQKASRVTVPFQIDKVIEIDRFALQADFLFPDSDLANLTPYRDQLEPDHIDFASSQILLGIQSTVLRYGDRVILVDTCVGGCKDRPKRPDWHQLAPSIYLGQLAALGLRPEDVDLVFCTHLHADHVGWNTKLENGRWVPTFPNARYIVSKSELDHWLTAEAQSPEPIHHGSFADSVRPILEAGLFDQVSDGFSIGKGLDLIGLPGHSPGQIGLMLHRNQGADLCFCGDAFHSVAQAYQPEWSSRFCADPLQSAQTRKDLLARASCEGTILIPSHIRGQIGFTFKNSVVSLLSDL